MRCAYITLLWLAIIGLMVASYASIGPLPEHYQSADLPQQYEPPMAPRCHDVRNCDGYVEGIPQR